MVRIEDLNITFFHLPKNAGSSIAQWLATNINGEEYDNELRHMHPEELKYLFDDFGWSFCCVRNPWDRMVSLYNFYKKQKKITISFEEYMDYIVNGEWSKKYVKPISTQYHTIIHTDYIIRYENLIEDFKVIQNKLYCNAPLRHLNKSEHTKYTDYYTKDEYINWIGERYSDEITMLDYSFGE